MIRTRALFLLALAGQAVPALAQPPVVASQATASTEAIAAARKLMTLIRVDETFGMMFTGLIPVMAQATVGTLETNPGTAAIMTAMSSREGGRERVLAIFSEEYATELKKATPSLVEETAREYATAFSASELDQLVAFYSGGSGGKLVRLLPELQQKMQVHGQRIGRQAGEIAGRRAMTRAMEELLPAPKGDNS